MIAAMEQLVIGNTMILLNIFYTTISVAQGLTCAGKGGKENSPFFLPNNCFGY
jgi:hypothetical protein